MKIAQALNDQWQVHNVLEIHYTKSQQQSYLVHPLEWHQAQYLHRAQHREQAQERRLKGHLRQHHESQQSDYLCRALCRLR